MTDPITQAQLDALFLANGFTPTTDALPTITITTPNTTATIRFHRTADLCWTLEWPPTHGGVNREHHASLTAAFASAADLILKTEF